MIIVVAATAIGTFALPGYQNQMSWRDEATCSRRQRLCLASRTGQRIAAGGHIPVQHRRARHPYMSPLAPWRWTALAGHAGAPAAAVDSQARE